MVEGATSCAAGNRRAHVIVVGGSKSVGGGGCSSGGRQSSWDGQGYNGWAHHAHLYLSEPFHFWLSLLELLWKGRTLVLMLEYL